MPSAENDAASEGWVPFGALIEHSGWVEFSTETDEAGMPLWERVIPPEVFPVVDNQGASTTTSVSPGPFVRLQQVPRTPPRRGAFYEDHKRDMQDPEYREAFEQASGEDQS